MKQHFYLRRNASFQSWNKGGFVFTVTTRMSLESQYKEIIVGASKVNSSWDHSVLDEGC